MDLATINKRVLKDISEGQPNLLNECGIYMAPEENNYYNIHYVITGPPKTPFEG